jgi:uncharacterized membrane protein YjjP (DUF1212 family)
LRIHSWLPHGALNGSNGWTHNLEAREFANDTGICLAAANVGAGSCGDAIFGVHHLKAVVLTMVSAAAGAVLRRILARYSANTLLQPLCAALLAGMIGALAVRYNLSSSLRLVAVCPCVILVPGPHVLNGAMDLIAARINLGASRLVHATLLS